MPKSLSPIRRQLIIILSWLAIAGLGICVSVYVAFLAICTEVHYEADYAGATFMRWGSRFTYLNCDDASTCDLIVDIPGHGRFEVSQIPETVIAPMGYSPRQGWYRCERSDWHFQDGRLTSFSIEDGSTVRIGTRTDGEFFGLPVTPKELRRAWGNPDRSLRLRRKKVIRFS